jgi:hypothetical protein
MAIVDSGGKAIQKSKVCTNLHIYINKESFQESNL